MDSKFEKLKKEKKLEGVKLNQEGILPPKQEVFGEVNLKPAEETLLLEQIQRLKSEAKKREEKEGKLPGLAQDDQAVTGVSAAPDDEEEEKPIKYYGYQVSQKAIEMITEEMKKKLNLSVTWRAVWLTRLMQMS